MCLSNLTGVRPLLFSDSNEIARKRSLHFAHIVGQTNETMPSLLVPYCSFPSKILGGKSSGYNFPFCDILEPVVFDGRLCYSVGKEFGGKSKEGKENGLLLMINPGRKHDDKESESLQIYVHTLSGFSTYKTGSFALNSLKKMTGTSGFMDLPDEQKRCQVELREDCQAKEILHEMELQCGCVPWEIYSVARRKVLK